MNKKQFFFIYVLLIMIQATSVTLVIGIREAQAVAAAGAKLIDEVVEVAARVSGRSLTRASHEAARQQLSKAIALYGDNVLDATRRGGLELMEVATSYGDDVWKYAAKVPEGAVALTTRPETILPLARSIGPDVLRLEAKMPGIAPQVARAFGDDAVPFFSRAVPAKDMTRLVGYANHAESPAARKLLLNCYKDAGTEFLDRLDWKKIVATGLSVSMISAAYQVSDGFQDGLESIAQNSPETFKEAINNVTNHLMFPYVLTFSILGVGWALIFLFKYYRKNKLRHTISHPRNTTT